MKLTGINGNFTGANTAVLALPVFKNEKAASAALKDLDKITGGLVAGLMKAEGFKGEVLARYQATGSPLLSGYLLGERFLNNRAAALDIPHGDGHIVLLGFRPQWRGQSFGTFRVVFNAVLR